MTEGPLEQLHRLLGSWSTEAMHPALPGVVVHGTSVMEWLEGERFLIWHFQREAPGFSQRFTGLFSDGGDTIDGQSQLSRDGSSWDDDLQITFRRRP